MMFRYLLYKNLEQAPSLNNGSHKKMCEMCLKTDPGKKRGQKKD